MIEGWFFRVYGLGLLLGLMGLRVAGVRVLGNQGLFLGESLGFVVFRVDAVPFW